MPSRNVVKTDIDDNESYFHIYARAASKQTVFVDDNDFEMFISLFARYLSKSPQISSTGVAYPYYAREVKLLAYCIMGNHYHLLVYQKTAGYMTKLMRSIITSYSRYYNHKYKRSGALFETRYKATKIDNQAYLEHISRYIHLNPRYWKRYKYSSAMYYSQTKHPGWLDTDKILGMFRDHQDYVAFLSDYESNKQMLDEMKNFLADK